MNQKGIAPIILLFGILIIISIGGEIYYYKTSQQTKFSSVTQTFQAPNHSTSPEVETLNWKTYTNKDYHYSIKYPAQFMVDDQNYPQVLITVNNDNSQNPGLSDIGLFPSNPALKCTTDTDCFNNVKELYKNIKGVGSKVDDFTFVSAIISGRTVQGIEFWNPTNTPRSSLTTEYDLSLNGNDFVLKFDIDGYSTKAQAQTNSQLAIQILSTFKFID